MSSIDRPRANPSALRSSLKHPHPSAAICRRGLRARLEQSPGPEPRPSSPGRARKRPGATPSDPAPTRPAIPNTSPRCEGAGRPASAASGRTGRTGRGSARSTCRGIFGNSSVSSRPTIRATMSRERGVRQSTRTDRPAVAEDHVTLGHPLHFLQEVADVNDRQPPSPEPVDDLEEPSRVAFGQGAGRLVEHDHPGIRHQGPGHLDQLPGPDAQAPRLRASSRISG